MKLVYHSVWILIRKMHVTLHTGWKNAMWKRNWEVTGNWIQVTGLIRQCSNHWAMTTHSSAMSTFHFQPVCSLASFYLFTRLQRTINRHYWVFSPAYMHVSLCLSGQWTSLWCGNEGEFKSFDVAIGPTQTMPFQHAMKISTNPFHKVMHILWEEAQVRYYVHVQDMLMLYNR